MDSNKFGTYSTVAYYGLKVFSIPLIFNLIVDHNESWDIEALEGVHDRLGGGGEVERVMDERSEWWMKMACAGQESNYSCTHCC